ncbi:MAG TPA: hypothetical protein VLS89_12120 [Candidatus Nanopelagicales bacterium]|nr:hypothetical protein [Candidatus Nanopelagicales bacterium]
MNEGSLLRRTLIHVGTFALGWAAFVALTSFLLVTTAQAVLPSPESGEAGADEDAADASGDEAATAEKPSAKLRAPRRPRGASAAAPEAAE